MSDPRTTPPLIEVFKERCEARALLVRNGKMELGEAVDRLRAAAKEYGPVRELGPDAVHEIMAESFGRILR